MLRNDRDILTSAERVAKGMTMRQMLLWGDDEAPRSAGRPKGTVAAGTPRAKTAEERVAEAESETREILGKLLAFLRGNWLETVSQQTRDDFARTLRDCANAAEERMR